MRSISKTNDGGNDAVVVDYLARREGQGRGDNHVATDYAEAPAMCASYCEICERIRLEREIRNALAKRVLCNPPGYSYWRDYIKSCVRQLRALRKGAA